MELRHLRYFLAAAEAGNFTRAAEECFVAQSALSAQIARLEAELGSPLFLRSVRGIQLTEAGEVLRPRARQLLADARLATEEISALSGVLGGRLRLGVIQGLPAELELVTVVSAFCARNPEINLSVQTGASARLAEAVLHGELDVAIVALPPGELPRTLSRAPLVDDPLVGVMSARAARGLDGRITVEQLLTRGPFLHYRSGSGLRHSVSATFERAGVQPSLRYEFDQISDMVRLAPLGAGVTIVPAGSTSPRVSDSGASPPCRVLELADLEAVHGVSLIHAGRLAPTVRAFTALLDELAPQAGRSETCPDISARQETGEQS